MRAIPGQNATLAISLLCVAACGKKSSQGEDCPAGSVLVEGACCQICENSSDCTTPGTACTNSCCRPSSGPHIDSVNGDGDADATSGHVPNHIGSGLRVTGTGLTGVTVALIAIDSGLTSYASLAVRGGATDSSLEVDLPIGLDEGNYSLRVSNGAGTDQAQVYVLQGMPGTCDPSACSSQIFPGATRVSTLVATAVGTGGSESQSLRINGVEEIATPVAGIWLGVVLRSTHQGSTHPNHNRAYDPADTSQLNLLVVTLGALTNDELAIVVTQGDVNDNLNNVLSTTTSLADELVKLGASHRIRRLADGEAAVVMGYHGIGTGNGVMVISGSGSAVALAAVVDSSLLGAHTAAAAGGMVCGLTAATTGSAGGWPAVRSACATACGTVTAHMCDATEITRAWQYGDALPAGGAWVASISAVARVTGGTGSSVSTANDFFRDYRGCCNWNTGQTAVISAVMPADVASMSLSNCDGWSAGSGLAQIARPTGFDFAACSSSLPIACCF